jgi:hypothetical protein
VDRLSTIEKAVIDALKTIAKQTLPSGYKYYTSTGQADTEDMARAESNNATLTMVNHLLVADEEIGEETAEWDISQNVYTNIAYYEIRSQVYGSNTSDTPRRELKTKGNEILSDLRALFGYNHTLSGLVNWVKINSSRLEYSDNGDRIGGATQITKIEIEYSQKLLNPDIPTC